MGAKLQMTPTEDWVRARIDACRKSFTVVSPFVGPIAPQWFGELACPVDKLLVTRLDLPLLAQLGSQLDAVTQCASVGADVHSVQGLHAKVYVVDGEYALVTSANATYAGMRTNLECGVALDGCEAAAVARVVDHGLGMESRHSLWSVEELRALEPVVDAVRAAVVIGATGPDLLEGGYCSLRIDTAGADAILAAMSGWQLLTLQCVMELPLEFTLDDVYQIGLPRAKQAYPSNHHPKDKLRQQLQMLRDLGIVRFVDRGRYRRLVEVL